MHRLSGRHPVGTVENTAECRACFGLTNIKLFSIFNFTFRIGTVTFNHKQKAVFMKRRLCFFILAAILSTVLIAGCCGGGKKETKVVTQTTKTTTKGQELQDLKKAKDEGVISEKEYEDAKKKILKEE
jgi:hypothetical protein